MNSLHIQKEKQVIGVVHHSQLHFRLNLRKASSSDLPYLQELIESSVRELFSQDYTQSDMESALTHAFSIDLDLINDGTYYVAKIGDEIVGSGGWCCAQNQQPGVLPDSVRNQLSMSKPNDTAVVRAVFVSPRYARRGIGSSLMRHISRETRRKGFKRLLLVSTLTGRRLYQSVGFSTLGEVRVILPDGANLPGIQMEKLLCCNSDQGHFHPS